MDGQQSDGKLLERAIRGWGLDRADRALNGSFSCTSPPGTDARLQLLSAGCRTRLPGAERLARLFVCLETLERLKSFRLLERALLKLGELAGSHPGDSLG